MRMREVSVFWSESRGKNEAKASLGKAPFHTIRGEERNRVNQRNKAGYTVNPVASGWAGAVLENITRAFGQEQ